MADPSPESARILFLYSETGGGHRSAGEAIIEALNKSYAERVRVELVDILKDACPPPLNYLPSWYPYLVKVPQLWGMGYRVSNSRRGANLVVNAAWPYVRRSVNNVLLQHPSDLIVSLHPLANLPFLRAGCREHAQFVTVVTDMVSTHAFWYHPGVDMCFVPTERAAQRAQACGLSPEQVIVTGLPVAEGYYQPMEDRLVLRQELGWPLDGLTAILMGGAEGFGPIEACARQIADAGLDLTLVVVTGRNEGLKRRLQAQKWPIPTYIYGFVEQMTKFMRAADILVTKAGPATINEALNAGLPMVLHSKLPGQEEGNVEYVESSGAGVWAPEPRQVVSAIRSWIEHPAEREAASAACRRVARPEAAQRVSRTIAEMLHL